MAQYTFDTLKDFEPAGIYLPSGYQRVEWLQATGTQYINTGLMIGANDVEYNFKWREISAEVGTALCGNKNPWSGSLYHPSAGRIYAAVGNSDGQGTRAIPINSWITANYTAKNGAWSFRTNETTLSGSYSGTVINSNYNLFLFCNSGVQEFSKYSQIPFFELKVGGVLLRSFVACRRTSDSVAGMYDVVNGVFYSNAGTGTFSIGGDVPTYNFQNGDEIIISSTKTHYHYQDGNLVFYYQEIPPLAFRGITFEQTDYWQRPEMVFRGLSFEGENILRYYGVKIDVNGETERNYIPCIRTSDGIAGMYDTVNGVFYASVGTNNFTT